MSYSLVKLIAVSKPVIPECETAQDLIAYCARVSNPKNQGNKETASNLVKYLVKHKHWSPLEMVHVTMEIITTRDIARQILRHRSFSFQEFCVSGDTLITTVQNSGRTKKVSIENLYKRYKSKQYWDMSDNLVKIYDRKNNIFKTAKIKEVFYTGLKDVYELELENGKKIKSTNMHKFLTKNGFKRLKDITEEDFVAVNGIPVWQDYNWLKTHKEKSIHNKLGLQYLASEAGVSKHTIRKWLKKYGLQYTKKEVASYTTIWNKGLPAEKQPMFNKYNDEKTREKMRKSVKKQQNSNFYKNGLYSGNNLSWRKKVCNWAKGFHQELLIKQNYRCALSGRKINKKNSHVDHIFPVFSNPELAFDKNNLQVVHEMVHKEKSKKESLLSRYTAKYSKVKSIKYIGKVDTYDLEVDHEEHNYVANGIIVHNSQRYAKAYDFVIRDARLQDEKNRQNSIETDDDELKNWWVTEQAYLIDNIKKVYDKALSKGIAKECARSILPEGCTISRMYMAGSLRSWYHYCELRMGNGTQKEHQEVAEKCWEILCKEFPILKEIEE